MKKTVVPSPGALSAQIAPPCASMIPFATNGPSPTSWPADRRVVEKRWKNVAR